MKIPVFICTGFLDSGKTTLIKDTLMEQEWIEPGPTLLLLCEEGEEEYQQDDCADYDADDCADRHAGCGGIGENQRAFELNKVQCVHFCIFLSK